MKIAVFACCIVMGMFHMGASSDEKVAVNIESTSTENQREETPQSIISHINININGKDFDVTTEENTATQELIEMLKSQHLVISMSEYGGFEKVGSLGSRLTSSDRQITTQLGDIVLYNGSSIVVFYGSNTWSYTKLGRVNDLDGFVEALGSGDVTITFSIE